MRTVDLYLSSGTIKALLNVVFFMEENTGESRRI
jgi:hypothetical protein